MSEDLKPSLFSSAPAEKRSELVKIAAVLAVVGVLLAGVVVVRGYLREKHRQPESVRALDAYAAQLQIEHVAMAQAGHGVGGESLYLDGQIKNVGPKTLTALTVQVVFHADDGSTVKIETMPMALVRTLEPYVDVQPIVADPVAPGQGKDFRLILENVPEIWNQKVPEIRPVRSALR